MLQFGEGDKKQEVGWQIWTNIYVLDRLIRARSYTWWETFKHSVLTDYDKIQFLVEIVNFCNKWNLPQHWNLPVKCLVKSRFLHNMNCEYYILYRFLEKYSFPAEVFYYSPRFFGGSKHPVGCEKRFTWLLICGKYRKYVVDLQIVLHRTLYSTGILWNFQRTRAAEWNSFWPAQLKLPQRAKLVLCLKWNLSSAFENNDGRQILQTKTVQYKNKKQNINPGRGEFLCSFLPV